MAYIYDLLNDYSEIRECEFEGERYSVRNNGAVMRHPKSTRMRQHDSYWTFGIPDKAGYPAIAGKRVHRIVAAAFLPSPERDDFVIDHIDTNKRNNRVSNLHWVSRLDNIIKNPITRKKIELVTGLPIEEVLKDMSVLRNLDLKPNLAWMRYVSQEEATRSLKTWLSWAENPNTRKRYEVTAKSKMGTFHSYHDGEKCWLSRTPGVLLAGWRPDGDFFACPGLGHTLEDYLQNIHKGEIFYRNDYGHEIIISEAAISNDGTKMMVKGVDKNGVKGNVLSTVWMEDGLFAHERYPYFDPLAMDKYYELGLGHEWKGGDVFDDYC